MSIKSNLSNQITKTIYLDIMLEGQFQCTLPYKCFKNIPIDENKLREYVLKKIPTLKGKPFTIEI